jgi:hypothetical protein
MNHDDLHGAFDDLARRGAADQADRLRRGDGISADRVTSVARSHRRRRAAVASVAGFALLSGAAVAGTTVLDRPAPPQPAAPSPTSPSPVTPSPTASAPPRTVALPQGDPSLPFGTCGSLAGAVPPLPVDDRFEVALEIVTDRVATGQPLAVSVGSVVDHDTMPLLSARRTDGPQIALLRDGVVVAVSTTGVPPGPDLGWTLTDLENYAGSTINDWYAPVTCAAAGQEAVPAGVPLPDGTYTLQAWAEVVDLGDDRSVLDGGYGLTDAAIAGGTHAIALADPVSVVLEGEVADELALTPNADAALVEPAAVDWPSCGGPAPVPSPALSFRLTTSAPGTPVRLADLGQVSATWEYVGPGRVLYNEGGSTWLTLVRDGVVVGTNFVHWDSSGPMIWGSGLPITSDRLGTVALEGCGEDGNLSPDTLAPGEYETYVHAFLLPREYQLPDGSVVAADAGSWTHVYAEPFTLVVD